MTLRRTIIVAAMLAGCVFTLMLGWMVYFTYPVPMPSLAAFSAFSGVVLLFWWLVGSLAANVIERDVNRSVSAIRNKLEDHISLRRRLESQRSLIRQFTAQVVPLVASLSEQAQAAVRQSGNLAQPAVSEQSFGQLQHLADECATALGRLIEHANQGLAQLRSLEHDLTGLQHQETQLRAHMEPLQRLAQQCNYLALNASIAHARTLDRTGGVGLLTEEIKQLSTSAEAMTLALQAHAEALQAQAAQSARNAQPLAAHVEAVAGEALGVQALADEQWEVLDTMRRETEALGESHTSTRLRQHLGTTAEAIKTASASLRRSLEGLVNNLQTA